MKKAKSPISRKAIFADLKKVNKRNITFSLNEDLIKEFKNLCIENDVSMNEVVEKLIESFLIEKE